MPDEKWLCKVSFIIWPNPIHLLTGQNILNPSSTYNMLDVIYGINPPVLHSLGHTIQKSSFVWNALKPMRETINWNITTVYGNYKQPCMLQASIREVYNHFLTDTWFYNTITSTRTLMPYK